MKAIIEIEMGNAAFGNGAEERIFELENVFCRLLYQAEKMGLNEDGHFVTAQDSNGNTVAKMRITEGELAL